MHSDIEINVWVETPPEASSWRKSLELAGATKVTDFMAEGDAGHFHWCVCSFRGVWVEIGWALTSEFSAFVNDLSTGKYVGHQRLQFGWTVAQALPLRTTGHLLEWKRLLARYPPGLAARVIADQTSVWSDPHVPGVRWALAARKERMGLALRFSWDIENLLRVLFAVNEEWDHDLKWTDAHSLELRHRPRDLSERIDLMFSLTELPRAVEVNQRLIIETLELASSRGFEVEKALESIRAGLREGLCSSL